VLAQLEKTAEYWSSRASASSTGRNAGTAWWEAGPEIQRHINHRITGSPEVGFVEYTLHRHFDWRLPMDRCLSLGCGTGALERALAECNAFLRCDAFDIAEEAVDAARIAAHRQGFDHITYAVADANRLDLPSACYDSVWIHGAMHHFSALEHVCRQIAHALRPDGLLVLLEYVGPSQFQFTARQKELTNLCLRLLPAAYRTITPARIQQIEEHESLQALGLRQMLARVYGKLRDRELTAAVRRRLVIREAKMRGELPVKTEVKFPSPRDLENRDPSEAIRSAEIIPAVEQYFEIVERKDIGGSIYQFLLDGIAGNFGKDDASRALLRMLLNIENTLLDCGEITSDYAYIVARPSVL